MSNNYRATISDAAREHTSWVGAEHPDTAWILSPYDIWERNPHWNGKGDGRHPDHEDDESTPSVDARTEQVVTFGPEDDIGF